jgi:hypothetical protein
MSQKTAKKPFRITQLDCCKKRLEVRCATSTGMLSQKLTAEQIARLAHTSVKNAYRWIDEPSRIPRASWELLQIKALGLIPDPNFEGWRVVDGEIFTPDDKQFGLEALRQFQMVYNENRILRQELGLNREEKTIQHDSRQRAPRQIRGLPSAFALGYDPQPLPANTADFMAHAIKRGKMAP